MVRYNTKVITIGDKKIGGGNPVLVQSMTKTFTADVKSTIKQIRQLEEVGCEIVRVAIPDFDSAYAIKKIKKSIKIPLVGDIHFDYRLAIEAIKNGVDKIRINPGNIGDEEKVKQIIFEAKKAKIPIRIGLNSGSIKKGSKNVYTAMMDTLKSYIKMFNKYEFDDIVISAKASDVLETVEIYKNISKKYNYPLHIGITESGPLFSGSIKSSLGIGILLYEGIGDTIRVSLTSSPLDEVRVAYEILSSLKLRNCGINIISCPTCGRCKSNLQKIVSCFEEKIKSMNLNFNIPINVAIMGCEVNGPGEAKGADVGVAFGRGSGILFVKGKIIKKVKEKDVISNLISTIKNFVKYKNS
jgi:(E)-4-hydroxy-3-methylbut-2-enyl-diphosphate synthase